MGQLSNETSNKIQREVEITSPETKILSVLLDCTDERNEEKIHIDNENLKMMLHSGKEISVEIEDTREESKREIIDNIRGLPIEKEKATEILVDVKMEKQQIPIIIEIRSEDKNDELRLERDISEKMDRIYTRAEELAREFEDLRYYSTHTHPHIKTVIEKSLEVSDRLGYDLDEIKKEVIYSSLSHDLGMAGIPRDDTKNYDKNEIMVDLKEVRPFHPIASAVDIIRNEELYRENGVNPGHVALEALLHSKTASKTDNLNEPIQIYKMVERLEIELDKRDLINEKSREIIDDLKDLFDKDDQRYANPDRIDELNQVKTVAIITSIGDAFSHTHGTIEKGLSQAGEMQDCRYDDPSRRIGDIDIEKYKNPLELTPQKETEGITVFTYIERDNVREETGCKIMANAQNDKEAAFLLGEDNVRFDIRPEVENQRIIVNAEIQDGYFYPASTYMAISERIEEFPRIHFYDNNERELEIEFRIHVKNSEELKENLTDERYSILSEYIKAKSEKIQEDIEEKGNYHIKITQTF